MSKDAPPTYVRPYRWKPLLREAIEKPGNDSVVAGENLP